MLFPFRTSTIFKNRWVALLWAAGICFMASEIVDSVSGVTAKHDRPAAAAARPAPDASSDDPVVVALGNAPPRATPAPPPSGDEIVN